MTNENLKNGFILFYRSIAKDNKMETDMERLGLWTYLLSHACFKEVEVDFGGSKRMLKPGERTYSVSKLSEQFNMNRNKLTRYLDSFEKEGKIERESDKHCTLIRIVNWDIYQHPEAPKKKKVEESSKATDNKMPTLEEVKKYFEDNNFKSSPEDFYNFNSAAGWVMGNGKPVTNWRSYAKGFENKSSGFKNKKETVNSKSSEGNDIESMLSFAEEIIRNERY